MLNTDLPRSFVKTPVGEVYFEADASVSIFLEDVAPDLGLSIARAREIRDGLAELIAAAERAEHIAHETATACVAACVCGERGYCADVPSDPIACPVCVHLGYSDACPGESAA